MNPPPDPSAAANFAPTAGSALPLSLDGPDGSASEGDTPPPERSVRGAFVAAASFAPYLRPVLPLVIGVVLVSLLISLLRLPFFYVPVVLTLHFGEPDSNLYRRLAPIFGPQGYLQAYLIFALVCMLASGGLGLLRGSWSIRASEHLLYLLRRDVFGRIETLSMKAVYASGAGEFVQRLTRDLYYIRDLYGETFTEMVIALLQVGVFLAAMLWMEPVLTLGLLLLLSLVAPAVRAINRRVEREAGGLQRLNETILSQLVECIGGYRDIRASGRFDRVARRFGAVLVDAERTSVRTTLWAQTGGVLMSTATSTVLVLPYLIHAGSLRRVDDVGRLITYVGFLSQVLPIFSMLARGTSSLAIAAPSVRAVREMLDAGGLTPSPAPGAPLPPATPAAPFPRAEPDVTAFDSIRFQDVGLFLGGRWIVQDLSFEIPGRKLTAIVGQSGAGKTTIFHLLLRLAEPTQGTIWINDRPLGSFDDRQLRRILGFIPQNPFIFNQTIRENLQIALPGEDGDGEGKSAGGSPSGDGDALVLQAVELAQLTPFLEGRRHEGGLEAVAGYMGMRLSAGERQRIALARLIIQDPRVIVCDEYTANIDVTTANLIEDMMRTRFADRTRVLITHELYSIKGADHVIVLDQGRVECVGRHDQLATRPGLYRTLWESQRLD